MKMSLEGSDQRQGGRSGEKLVGQGKGHVLERCMGSALRGSWLWWVEGRGPLALPWGTWLGAHVEGTVGK